MVCHVFLYIGCDFMDWTVLYKTLIDQTKRVDYIHEDCLSAVRVFSLGLLTGASIFQYGLLVQMVIGLVNLGRSFVSVPSCLRQSRYPCTIQWSRTQA